MEMGVLTLAILVLIAWFFGGLAMIWRSVCLVLKADDAQRRVFPYILLCHVFGIFFAVFCLVLLATIRYLGVGREEFIIEFRNELAFGIIRFIAGWLGVSAIIGIGLVERIPS